MLHYLYAEADTVAPKETSKFSVTSLTRKLIAARTLQWYLKYMVTPPQNFAVVFLIFTQLARLCLMVLITIKFVEILTLNT